MRPLAVQMEIDFPRAPRVSAYARAMSEAATEYARALATARPRGAELSRYARRADGQPYGADTRFGATRRAK